MSYHVFLDGLNVGFGGTLDEWRALAPRPIDRYEQNVVYGWVLKDHSHYVGICGAAGGAIVAAAALPWPLVLLSIVVAWIAMEIVWAAWMRPTRRFALWLATKRSWDDGLRAGGFFLFFISPLVGLFALAAVAAR